MLTLCLAMSLTAAPSGTASGEAWVVLMRRSGVPQAKAMEIAREVSAQLTASGVPNSAPVEDLSKCNGKKPCLVEAARKKKYPALVLVEVGTVLDDAFARAEAISIEEDGKRLALAEADGKLASLSESLKPKVAASLVGPLQTLLGISPPPVVVAQPEPPPTPAVEKPVEKPVEQPADKPVVAKKPLPEIEESGDSKPFMTTQRTVGLVVAGAGAATLIVSGVLGGSAAGAASEYSMLCPTGMQCNNPAAYAAYNKAAGAQNSAMVVAGIGAGVLVTGVIVFLTGGASTSAGSDTGVSFAPLPGGGAVSVSGSF